MEMSVSSETAFFNMKLQLEICQSSAEDTGRIDTGPQLRTYFELQFHIEECRF